MTRVLSAVAWPYANGPRHIGHVAGFGVPSDVFSRYMRMAGHDVLMVSGSDEHGTPILIAADEEGVSPQDLADRNHRVICEDFVALGLGYDLYTRTSTRNHHGVVQEMFLGVFENGYLVEQTTYGAISPSTGRTLPDRYIQGTCPICGYDRADADQCDSCGNQLEPQDLIEPRSKINGEKPEFVETQHFFLDLPALAEALSTWLDEREQSGTWRPNVIRFSQNILAEIRPRAMTRDIDWGITVPLEGWRENPNKKLYVWFDAVIGYLSASIEWARRSGSPEAWRAWWNDPEALSYYFMGKDNITFHSQVWPAELLAYDGRGDRGGSPGELGDLNLPTEVVSSEYLTMEGRKFSSSKRVVIYVRDMLSRYQPDAFRYFVAASGPESQDSDFTWAEFVRRTNDELVAGWGNLVNRTASLIAKSFGEIPAAGALAAEDEKLLATVESAFATVGDLIGRNRMRQAIAEAMRTVAEVNKYVSDTEPWKLTGEDHRERLATVLHVVVQCVADLNLVLAPFLPFSANAVDPGAGRPRGGRADAVPEAGRRPRRWSAVPDHHRRVLRHAPVAAPAGGGGQQGRPAHARLHQARPGRGRGGASAAGGLRMLHPQARAALELWAAGPAVTDPGFGAGDIARMRAAALEAARLEPREPVAEARDVDADGVPCRLYLPHRPVTAGQPAVVVYLHGGGFVFGDLDTHDAQSRRVANRTGHAVLTVDYRRPPEHRFPAAPDDVDTALGWLRAHGHVLGLDVTRTVALGDSAGGNLAVVAALRAPGTLRAAVLVYPFLDPRQDFASYRDPDVGLDAEECAWFWRRYAAGPDDLGHPHLAPLRSEDIATLPPSLVLAAEHDVLRDEDVELARRLRRADVPVELTTYDGMVHGFWRHPELFDAAEESLGTDRRLRGSDRLRDSGHARSSRLGPRGARAQGASAELAGRPRLRRGRPRPVRLRPRRRLPGLLSARRRRRGGRPVGRGARAGRRGRRLRQRRADRGQQGRRRPLGPGVERGDRGAGPSAQRRQRALGGGPDAHAERHDQVRRALPHHGLHRRGAARPPDRAARRLRADR